MNKKSRACVIATVIGCIGILLWNVIWWNVFGSSSSDERISGSYAIGLITVIAGPIIAYKIKD